MTDNQQRDVEINLNPIETLAWLRGFLAAKHPWDWTDHDIALIEERIQKAITILGNDASERIKQKSSRYDNRA